MSNDLTLPAGFGLPPAALRGDAAVNDELGQGVSSSYAVVGYRGKVWSIKFGGEEKQLMRDDGDGPRNSIEVVLVKSSAAISKIFYENGYEPGSSAAPDCWSGNGVAPDSSVQKKQNPTCADCPRNAWGSKITEQGKQAKACADARRVAVVPAADMGNEAFGGPMLLRVPAASLKDLKAYGDLLMSYQFPYYAAVTRISFDPEEAFPKFKFSAVRPLNEEEGEFIRAMRDDPRVKTVLVERPDAAAPVTPGPTVPSSPFEQPGQNGDGAPAATTAATTAAKPAAPKPAAPKPAAPKPAAPKAPDATTAASGVAEGAATVTAAPPVESPAAKAARLKAELLKAELAALEAEAAAEAGPEDHTAADEEGDSGIDDFDKALEGILQND